MEVLEKKDLLKLSDDPFVKSILGPKGIFILFRQIINIYPFRGNISLMFYF